MKIFPLASGSSGNCYYISDGDTALLLDCGISFEKIKRSLWDMGVGLADISACLVTHAHIDHVKSAQKLADMGVDIYTSQGTIDAAGIKGHRIHAVASQKPFGIGYHAFIVTPFDVEHDAPEPLGFYLWSHAEQGGLLYITDTEYLKYSFDGIKWLMIEANYDPDIIAENAVSGSVNAARVKRTINNHMSIETALLTLERIDRSRLKEVWLLHLSNDNAADNFKRRVQELCGCEVYVA